MEDLILHNDCICLFNERLYSDIFSEENITSKKKCVTLKGQKYYGYYLEKGKENFFMLDEAVDKMPFKVINYNETDYKGEVFKAIIEVKSISIPSEKKLSFRELVDITPAFKHTNPKHFLLYKIVALVSYIDRINARISTDAGFGKDSVVSILQQLVNSTVNIYGATFAKLEYSLLNKLIILNEMGNLKKEERVIMQEFLLAVGAYFNSYTKRTRKTALTQEQYDISKLSLLIFYNLPSYYLGKGQEYFDQIFTPAVSHRFMPFVFDGRLTTRFEDLLDARVIVDNSEQVYKDIIATLNYYRANKVMGIAYNVPAQLTFSDKEERYSRTFNTILKYVAEYSETQEEFNDLSTVLYGCFRKYEGLLVKAKEME